MTKEKFETVTTTVKKTSKFVPFEKILDVDEIPKDGEPYYLLRSKSAFVYQPLNRFTKQ